MLINQNQYYRTIKPEHPLSMDHAVFESDSEAGFEQAYLAAKSYGEELKLFGMAKYYHVLIFGYTIHCIPTLVKMHTFELYSQLNFDPN